ncbi:uncharacterized protein LOC120706104 [Panicum virgatum]|uniref:uncharacterized protein LOC120706104 n=1 Tax=Panicum virgatum TaxID=38727 RepID=UPI0019D63650|nr:uncharacterized protein LOC120706104 [Panicum virgatum]
MRGPVRSTGQAPASRPSLTTVRVHRIPNLTEPPPPPTTLGRPFQRKYRQDPILASERMMRRFVNILALAEKGSTGAYSLHRLDVAKHLFYPSTAEAVAAARPAIERLGQLPAPCVSFQPPQQCTLFPDPPQLQWFALVSPRSSEGRILYGNTLGNIALYDADTNSVECMPSLTGLQWFMPITISPVPVPPRRTSTSCTPSAPWAFTSSGSAVASSGRKWGP